MTKKDYIKFASLLKNLKVRFLEADHWINFGDVHDFNSYIYWQNFFSETNYIKL